MCDGAIAACTDEMLNAVDSGVFEQQSTRAEAEVAQAYLRGDMQRP